MAAPGRVSRRRYALAALDRWGELKGDVWTISGARTKNGKARAIPLPRQALAALGPRGADNALVFPSKRGHQLNNWDRETKKLQAASGTAGWTRHDVRRTGATILGDLGLAPHIIKVVLGHASAAEGVTAVYARSRYEREHREALQRLADEIDCIVGVGEKVVQLAALRKA